MIASGSRSVRALATLTITLGLSVFPLFGCGGGQTQGAAFDGVNLDDGTRMTSLQRQLAGVPIPRGADVAVGVFGERSLVGVKLEGGDTWTFEHPIACRPVVAGGVVVGVGADEMFALDARTGKQLWMRKAGGCLRGVADDGRVTVVSVRPTNGRGGIVVAIDRDGQVVRQIEDESNIGAPGMIDGFLFLPWDGRYVSAYDLAIGDEVARVRLAGGATRAFAVGGALFFGEKAATRFDEHVAQKDATTVTLPARSLPEHPAWMDSGNDALPPGALVSDRSRLYARPLVEGAAGVAGDRYAATYGRVAMGFEAKSGALDWVHSHDASFLGGAAYDGGFALCDAEGRVTFLDAKTGAVAGSVLLGIPIDACLVQADAFSKTAADPAKPLRDEIAGALRLQYADAEPIQRFLLAELTASTDEAATETLIRLVDESVAPVGLAPDVRAALGARKSGVSYMLTTLAKHYDYLDGVLRGPPVGPLADALASLGEKRAAPLLTVHLLDPITSAADVERAAAALEVLAGPEELPALRQFFAAYRETPDLVLALAVAHIAHALERLGHADLVAKALRDPYTSDLVRAKVGVASPAPKGPAR